MEAENNTLISDKQKKEWLSNWEKMMVTIWRDRMRQMRIWNTGQLYSSTKGSGTIFSGEDEAEVKILHNFLSYGIYVDMGVGKEFGKERFNDNEDGHHRGQLVNDVKRKPKPWFSRAYYRSVMVAKEFMAEAYGDKFKAILFQSARDIAKELRKNKSK